MKLNGVNVCEPKTYESNAGRRLVFAACTLNFELSTLSETILRLRLFASAILTASSTLSKPGLGGPSCAHAAGVRQEAAHHNHDNITGFQNRSPE